MRMNDEPESDCLLPLEPEGWPRGKGYAHAWKVPAGHDLVLTAGQIGWDASETLVSDDFAEQFGQALRNCVTLVESAGGQVEHIVRLTMFCRDRSVYLDRLDDVGRVYRAVMGRHFPAMSLVIVADLVEVGAWIEIEATAAIPPSGGVG